MPDGSLLPRMARHLACGVLLCAVTPLLSSVMAKDAPGSADHPLVGRYKGSEIIAYQSSDFDRVDLLAKPIPRRFNWSAALPEDLRIREEGRSFRIVYRAPADRSALEIDANFAESLKAKGFETLFSCVDSECVSGESGFYQLGGYLDDARRNGNYGQALIYRLARLSRPSGDVHVALLAGKGLGATHVVLRVVESKPMQGDQIAFIDAGQMRAGLESSGRVALYGIQFDFDKAEVKPESTPTLREIAKFLQAQPSLRLVVPAIPMPRAPSTTISIFRSGAPGQSSMCWRGPMAWLPSACCPLAQAWRRRSPPMTTRPAGPVTAASNS